MLLRRARPRAGDVVLDLACGSGWLLRRLARERPGIVGIGLDESPERIAAAREHARVEAIGGLTFVAGDWNRVDPELLLQAHGQSEIDLVCCVAVFHRLREPRAALEKVRRVLAPGGRLLLLDRVRDGSPLTVLADFVHRRLRRDGVRFHHSRALVALLHAAGFESVEVVDRGRRRLWKGRLALISAA